MTVTECARLTGEEYMALLGERRTAWLAEHPHAGPEWLVPLLEWFIRPGDEDLVALPAVPPPSRPARARRQYRSAASLRAERDRVQAQLDRLVGAGAGGDTAAVNASPRSRSRAAAAAGRRRMAELDRDVARAARLSERIARLDARIARAEHRERAVGVPGHCFDPGYDGDGAWWHERGLCPTCPRSRCCRGEG